ncbi:anthranilate synthase component I [Gluconobacter kanchanaburiensis]|uniref:Anthranilate synthase component 1 n=1 Tax=Gluconobacter kanchanaburiensis NBRC 103587 TaxID=1307948 RepID=A0A511BA87_9PROT|nr:anthranilate synthase component I [Gluconobacter kanchanaburiensis]MBF0862549.1 anthranilate synthase component I [Gluconobacter kanchanaburiensis]GBR71687.1 anthranilate synthase component I [Gluconobacter kanchanaburiensis NBRC 103587]GEK96671.1 anthranilate synthase component 1 [Gluconobacter kanchanaburiensis NBRC 103587]
MSVVHSVEAADLLTPVSAFLRLSNLSDDPYRLLFESVEGGAARGRYSVIALLPDLVWKCRDGQVTLDGAPIKGVPLDTLNAIVDDSQIELPPDMPPMIGGVFGVLGYDMVRQMERLPNPPTNDLGLPEGIMIRPRLFAVFDSVRDELTLAVPVRKGTTEAEAHALLARARSALAAPLAEVRETLPAGATLVPPVSNMTQQQFEDCVRKAQDYIAAGDAFQIVPSQRFTTPFPLSPLSLYRSLRRVNPAPFLFVMELEDYALVGSSPEILVRLRDGEVTVRPLAGTRPRGVDREEDLALEKELLADRKELAEHLMLIDLGRNDVGRVSMLGSVDVPEKFVVERYSHVMHISSTVTGRIAEGKTAMDALVAAFPAGTLTGAPKIRAMEIIDELEPTRRGPYSGCVGYFGADGEMDTCIGLRMAVLKDGNMYVQAGCGVVADSDPNAEFRETQAKARALFRAAEIAVSNAAKV